ncbi:hypothetical protein [Promicromonospora iranensis]|uniref:hypothetical protein n=1 Tax=Promicromonospora iranensis TaxID=1105144 RepID=UPI0023A9FBA3|nr:hypothetical protein [Promicromonospora iranensis]
MNRNDTMTPQEYAGLVRDARELAAAVERAVRRTGAVFVVTMGVTVASTALGLDLVASLAAVVAVASLAVALVSLVARIALGPMPAEVTHAAPAGPGETAPNGSGRPATGSGTATAENGVIPTK